MQGLTLSKQYFEAYGRKLIEEDFSTYKQYMAVGLVGEGSECFGYDDELSQDHDFGPGFCIWMPTPIYNEVGSRMQAAYDRLPTSFGGFSGRNATQQAVGRTGVFTIDGFYHTYTNCGAFPKNCIDWFKIPERFLAVAVNGEVFCDFLGTFTQARETWASFYPEDVLRKKLAARAAILAQSGQYNYGRCIKRKDSRAAFLACAEFVKTALSTIYLLNGTYMPFYKWAFRGADELVRLKTAVENLGKLVALNDAPEHGQVKQQLMESICIEIGREICTRGFSHTTDAFLQNHCEHIMNGIKDDRLRKLHVMADCE